MMADAGRTTRYLARLGVRSPGAPTIQLLRELHRRHVERVPFENLSIHVGEAIELEPDALIDKLTLRHRGGFCYELNGAFAELLRTLGFAVELLEGRVYGDGVPGIPFDHLALCVTIATVPYLADVGFGAGFLEPLSLAIAEEQIDPAGIFTIVEREGGWFDLVHDGVAQYVFSRVPRRLDEFAGGCRYHQTSPQSPFTRGTVCSLPTAAGRITLRNRRLLVTIGTEREERELAPSAIREVLAGDFGITLPGRLPTGMG